MKQHLIALDAGTGSCRAVIFDESGNQLSAAAREWIHIEEPGVPGSMSFDWNRNWTLLTECIREAVFSIEEPNIKAVAATSMREAIVLFDEKGKEIWACANVDSRSNDEVRELRARGEELEKEIYNISGQMFALGAIPRLLWIKKHQPEIYEKAAGMCMLSDWIAVRLGAEISIDRSNGGTTGLIGLSSRSWEPKIAARCGLKNEFLSARVYDSGEVIGAVSRSSAEETGLPEGIPIIMGGGDAQLGAVGVGAVKAGDFSVFGGSFWQQELNLSAPFPDRDGKIRLNFHAVPDLWQAETIVFFPGLVLRWFRDAMCPDIVRQAEAEHVSAYRILSGLAESVPAGSHGLIPIFSDSMDYSNWYHASPSFLNLSIDATVCTRGAMFRALMENAAIVTKANLQLVSEYSGKTPDSVIFAGGASKDPLWNQILSDVLQIPVHIPVVKEATALGAAMCAAYGAGMVNSFSEAVDCFVQEDRIYYPQSCNEKVYHDLYMRWRESYDLQRQLVDRNILQSMWRAPGQ